MLTEKKNRVSPKINIFSLIMFKHFECFRNFLQNLSGATEGGTRVQPHGTIIVDKITVTDCSASDAKATN